MEAGHRLGVSRATVYRMMKRGTLSSVREHGRRRIPESAVENKSRYRTTLDGLTPFTRESPIFKLMGKYSSGGRKPGSEDKHAILAERDWE